MRSNILEVQLSKSVFLKEIFNILASSRHSLSQMNRGMIFELIYLLI